MSDRFNPRRDAACRASAVRRLLRNLLRCRCGRPLVSSVEISAALCRVCANPPRTGKTARVRG